MQKYLRQQKEMDGSSSQQDGCGNMDHYADLSPPQGTEVSSSIPALTSQTVDDPDGKCSEVDTMGTVESSIPVLTSHTVDDPDGKSSKVSTMGTAVRSIPALTNQTVDNPDRK